MTVFSAVAGFAVLALSVSVAQDDLLLDGGGEWKQHEWKVTTDRVMGGRSTASAQFSHDGQTMRFFGNLNVNGGGFASARRKFPRAMDFSKYEGILVQLEAMPGISDPPLGLHVQLNDYSQYGYSAAIAIPRAASNDPVQIYIPMEQFSRANRMGYKYQNKGLNAKSVTGLDFYVLYQNGNFDFKVHWVKAVRSAHVPAMPSGIVFETAHDAVDFLSKTITVGVSTYNNGYHELCVALYWSALNTLMTAKGIKTEMQGVACEGLSRASHRDWSDQQGAAWELRHAIDDLIGVWSGHKADWSRAWAINKATECTGVTSIGPLKATPSCKNIAQLATETGALSTLLTAVKAANPAILKLLSDPSATLTVFAPSNDAFAALGDDALKAVLADQKTLTNLLKKHVLGSVVPAEAALKLKDASVTTLAGEDIIIDSGRKVFVAPTIIGGVSTVVVPDVNACNGVVHVVDEVLALDVQVNEEPSCKTIAQLASETETLSTLLAAVKAANPAILKLLSDPSATLTVFAPTDDAFAALGKDALKAVLADQGLLTNLLKKHVLGSVVPAEAALKLTQASVTTLAGEDITVNGGRKVKITPTILGGPAKVIIADVDACNGVVHVVDKVIALPKPLGEATDKSMQNPCMELVGGRDCKKNKMCQWRNKKCTHVCMNEKKKGKCKRKKKTCYWDRKGKFCKALE